MIQEMKSTKSKAIPICVSLILLCSLLVSAQILPDDEGKELVEKLCQACHGLEMTVDSPGDLRHWKIVVDEHKGRGAAQGTDEELAIVTAYLAKHFPRTVNVNTAAADEMEYYLPISLEAAEAIVKYRTEHGDIESWEDLEKIPGLDMEALEEQRAAVRFSD